MGTLGIQMIAFVAGGYVWRARKWGKISKSGGAASTPHRPRGFTAPPLPLSSKTAGYSGKTDKDPNNALDPNNSEVQLIETIINTERCVEGVALP